VGIGSVTVSALAINPGSSLDITSNTLTINYGSAASDPVATIRADLAAAFAAHYSGSSLALTSSSAAGAPVNLVLGYIDDAQTGKLQIAITAPGDGDLDGEVGFNDVAIVAANYGASAANGQAVSWSSGDFNYDNVVNFTDLAIVAQHLGNALTAAEVAELPASFIAQYRLALAEVGQTLNLSAAAVLPATMVDQYQKSAPPVGPTSPVPEPAGAAALALLAGSLLARRRR
jgi:hypothetical protein